jgi:NADH-quinone oxidoreductase subunit D
MEPVFYELTKLAQNDQYTTYEMFFGPNHPGMHGNFGYVVEAVGATVVKVRVNAGLLHRGFEKLMETKGWFQNLSLIPRICVVDPDPNEVAYCMAAERLCGMEIPEKAKYLRSLTLEMSRLTSLLMGMGALGAMMGLYSSMYRMMTDRDYVLDLFEWLTGARIYHIYNVPGGVRRDIPDGFLAKLTEVLDTLEYNLKEWDNLVFENPVVHKRLTGIGYITAEEAVHYGLVGPNLRATGFLADVRKDDPYAAYPYLDFETPVTHGGDALARAVQVRKEYEMSIKLVRQIIKKMPKSKEIRLKAGNTLKFVVPPGDTYARVESSKGEYGYYVVSDGGLKPYRVSVRGPSLPAGLTLCHKHLPGMDISDVAIWMASYAVCPPDIDR